MPEVRKGDVEALVTRLEQALATLEANQPIDPALRARAFPPASPEDIRAAEAKLKFAFPDSYKTFLRRHNGWKRVNGGDIWATGVSGPGGAKPQAELARYLKSMAKSYRRQGPNYVDELIAREKHDPKVMYPGSHPLLALNFNGDFWMFDRNRRSSGDEYEIAEVRLGETVDERFRSFPEFLEAYVEQAEESARESAPKRSAKTSAAPRAAKRRTRAKTKARKSSR